MANYVNPELCRIIRDVAYSQGRAKKIVGLITRLKNEQKKLEARLAALPAELAEAKEALKVQQAEVTALKVKVKIKAPKLPLHDIRAIVPTPKTGNWEWGDFKRELIDVLKAANGRPLSTSQLMAHCQARFGIVDQPLPSGGSRLRDAVGRPLRFLAKQGAVSRLPGPTPSAPAYWVWVGLE